MLNQFHLHLLEVNQLLLLLSLLLRFQLFLLYYLGLLCLLSVGILLGGVGRGVGGVGLFSE
jgi:hypothetical protein